MSTTVSTLSTMIEAIAGVVGKGQVITDAATLKQYSRDTSLMTPRMPDMVVKVANTSQVQGVMRIANENNYPVVPRSSGTGTYGTGIPAEGGIILDLSGM
jgi:FAD/FMN-containing dehydrogenase